MNRDVRFPIVCPGKLIKTILSAGKSTVMTSRNTVFFPRAAGGKLYPSLHSARLRKTLSSEIRAIVDVSKIDQSSVGLPFRDRENKNEAAPPLLVGDGLHALWFL